MLSSLKDDFKENIRRLPGMTPAEAEALIAALDTPPAVALRLNRRKAPASLRDSPYPDLYPDLYPDMTPVSWCADGRYLSARPLFTLNPLLHAGVFYVQDASSMIYQQIIEKIIEKIKAQSDPDCSHRAILGDPLRVLDFCAAPGGKTTAIINALPDGAQVVANEFVAARGKILRENLEKWGFPNVITTGSDSVTFAALGECFDIIAVDAPCSGEGMMRKDDDARSQWSKALTLQCAALQKVILRDIASILKPGGFLIYSTCTFNIEENELNSAFIRDELGLTPIPVDDLRLEGIEEAARALPIDADSTPIEALRFMPHLTRGEGLYVSVFRKDADADSTDVERIITPDNLDMPESGKSKKKKLNKKGTNTPKTDIPAPEWMDSDMDFQLNGTLVSAMPKAMLPLKDILLRAGVRITGAGLPAAEVKGRDLIPDSRAVLSAAFRDDAFPGVELSEEDALRFLRRESFPLPDGNPKGFIIVKYEGHPLGLMKNIGNRANNLYPQSWKIKNL